MSRRREVIKIKRDDEIDYLYLEGNVLDYSGKHMLMEIINLHQRDKYDNFSLSGEYSTSEYSKPFAVVSFDGKNDKAIFFDDLEQAHVFFDEKKNV